MSIEIKIALNFCSKFFGTSCAVMTHFTDASNEFVISEKKIILNEKKFDLASFYNNCFGISSDCFYFFISKVKVKKLTSIFQFPLRQG